MTGAGGREPARPPDMATGGRGRPAGEPLRRIDSPRNAVLRLVRALQTKRERRERRLVVVEGEDLLEAALRAGLRPEAVLLDETRVGRGDPLLAATGGVAARYLTPPRLLAGVSTLATPPRVLAIVPQPGPHHFRTVPFPPSLALHLGGVGDPGNVGTAIRSAAALGCDWVALAPGSADAFHPRAVRAAMGATFTIPVLEGVRAADLATREGFAIVAASPAGGVPPWEVDLVAPTVIALGAEREGLAATVTELPAGRALLVTIPQAPGTESLNVAGAAAALLAEAVRQRAAAGRAPRPGW